MFIDIQEIPCIINRITSMFQVRWATVNHVAYPTRLAFLWDCCRKLLMVGIWDERLHKLKIIFGNQQVQKEINTTLITWNYNNH